MVDARDNLEEKTKQVTELMKLLMQDKSRYHDHKESMAHAAMLLSVGMSGWLLVNWPLWVKESSAPSPFVARFVVIGLLFAIHVWMRWQFRNRRAAASLQTAYTDVLWKWAQTPPNDEKLKPAPRAPDSCIDCFLRVLDHVIVIPCRRTAVPARKVLSKNCPKAVAKAYRPEKTGALFGEQLVSYGNLVLIILVLMRMLLC